MSTAMAHVSAANDSERESRDDSSRPRAADAVEENCPIAAALLSPKGVE